MKTLLGADRGLSSLQWLLGYHSLHHLKRKRLEIPALGGPEMEENKRSGN